MIKNFLWQCGGAILSFILFIEISVIIGIIIGIAVRYFDQGPIASFLFEHGWQLGLIIGIIRGIFVAKNTYKNIRTNFRRQYL